MSNLFNHAVHSSTAHDSLTQETQEIGALVWRLVLFSFGQNERWSQGRKQQPHAQQRTMRPNTWHDTYDAQCFTNLEIHIMCYNVLVGRSLPSTLFLIEFVSICLGCQHCSPSSLRSKPQPFSLARPLLPTMESWESQLKRWPKPSSWILRLKKG